jgi:type VII secretion integral membrane protein EccD
VTVVAKTQPAGLRAAEQVRLAEQVRVAVLFGGRQTDVTLPAGTSVAGVVDALLRVFAAGDSGEADGVRTPDDEGMVSAGEVTLTMIDGRPLDRTQSLAQQGVADGDLLILEAADVEVEFTPIVEAPSSAVAVLNAARLAMVTEKTARVVAGITVAAAAVLATAVLGLAWWRGVDAGGGWNLWPAGLTAGLGVGLLTAGWLVWRLRADPVIAAALWLTALVVLPAAAVMAPPGRPGVWHAVLVGAVAATVAAVLWRLAPAARGLLAWLTITAAAALAMALVHAAGVSLVYVWVAAAALALVVLSNAAMIAGLMAGIPVPPFPTVTGKDTFDDAEHIAREALVAAEHAGTPSVAALARGAAAANTYLTAVVAATAVYFLGAAVGVGVPGRGRWWLATLYVVIVATILVLRGRSFTTRVQAIIVVGTGLVMLAIAAVKYAVVLDGTAVCYWVAAVVLAVGALAPVIATVVPDRVFSPVFRKLVEWLEYALIFTVIPLTVWLLNLYYLARNH